MATKKSVNPHIREVSLFQRLICTQKYTIGTSETVLIREVSLFQRLTCTQKYTIGTSGNRIDYIHLCLAQCAMHNTHT